MTALPALAECVRAKGWNDLVVVAPDPGRGKMAQKYAAHLDCDIAFMQKARRPDRRNASEPLGLIGDVRDRRCVVVDDLIDTGAPSPTRQPPSSRQVRQTSSRWRPMPCSLLPRDSVWTSPRSAR